MMSLRNSARRSAPKTSCSRWRTCSGHDRIADDWVSPRGGAGHNLRVKVNMSHGNQMSAANTAVIGVRPSPHLIAGRLSPEDERAVFHRIELNAAALVDYWDGQIDTIQLGQRLQPLSPPISP